MMDRTEQLIADLVTQAAPVRPLHLPLVRAAVWLVAIGALAALFIFSNARTAERTGYAMTDVEFWSMLATAVVGVLAAFELSVPGSSPRWTWAPVLPLTAWIASSGRSCYDLWRSGAPVLPVPAESPHCFMFIIFVSVPLAALLLWSLRRARPIAPLPVASTGGIGVAAAAAFLLQFFHPFDVTFMDLALHLVALGLVVGVLAAVGRKTLGGEQ